MTPRSLAGIVIIPFLAWWLIVPPPSTVVPEPAPSHMRWLRYPVGGRVLIIPVTPDSTHAVLLPPGTILLIPIRIAGEDPDPPRSKS